MQGVRGKLQSSNEEVIRKTERIDQLHFDTKVWA